MSRHGVTAFAAFSRSSLSPRHSLVVESIVASLTLFSRAGCIEFPSSRSFGLFFFPYCLPPPSYAQEGYSESSNTTPRSPSTLLRSLSLSRYFLSRKPFEPRPGKLICKSLVFSETSIEKSTSTCCNEQRHRIPGLSCTVLSPSSFSIPIQLFCAIIGRLHERLA
jgi:hypothetical protein